MNKKRWHALCAGERERERETHSGPYDKDEVRQRISKYLINLINSEDRSSIK